MKIYNASVTEKIYPGLLSLNVSPLPGGALTLTKGLGFTFGQNSTTLGYLNELVFIAPDTSGCRVVMFANNVAQIDLALRSLGGLDSFRDSHCTVLIGGAQ